MEKSRKDEDKRREKSRKRMEVTESMRK